MIPLFRSCPAVNTCLQRLLVPRTRTRSAAQWAKIKIYLLGSALGANNTITGSQDVRIIHAFPSFSLGWSQMHPFLSDLEGLGHRRQPPHTMRADYAGPSGWGIMMLPSPPLGPGSICGQVLRAYGFPSLNSSLVILSSSPERVLSLVTIVILHRIF